MSVRVRRAIALVSAPRSRELSFIARRRILFASATWVRVFVPMTMPFDWSRSILVGAWRIMPRHFDSIFRLANRFEITCQSSFSWKNEKKKMKKYLISSNKNDRTWFNSTLAAIGIRLDFCERKFFYRRIINRIANQASTFPTRIFRTVF